MATAPGPPRISQGSQYYTRCCSPPGENSTTITGFLRFSRILLKKTLFVLAQCTLHTLQVYREFFQANYTTHLSQRSFLSDVL